MTTPVQTGDHRVAGATATYGALLRQWRRVRRMSQLDLACEAEVSSRHISFLETGRSRPSREMVLRLATVLQVPARQSNALLRAAGYADHFSEMDLDDPALAEVRRSLELLLESHDPFPALAMDARWDVHLRNRAATRLLGALVDPEDLEEVVGDEPLNVLRVLFHHRGLRRHVVNWEEVGRAMLQRLQRESAIRGEHARGRTLLAELLYDPDLPEDWREPPVDVELPVVLPLHLRRGDLELRLFTAVTTLGTALDVTLGELVIETFLPADGASEAALRSL